MFNGKRSLMMGLVLAMALGISACGGKDGETVNQKKESQVTEELAPEYVYVADYVTLDEEQDFYNTQFVGNEMYNLGGVYDEETGYRQMLMKYELADGKIGEGKEILVFEDGMNANQYYVSETGEVYLVINQCTYLDPEGNKIPEEEYNFEDASYSTRQDYRLEKYDANGTKVFETDLNELARGQEWFYVQNFAVDGQGRSYLYINESGIALYDEKGNAAGKVELGGSISWINCMGSGKDGKVYISYYKNDANSGGYALAEVDYENKKIGDTYSNFVSGNNGFQKGIQGDFLVSDENALYEYFLADQKTEKILTWLDCDINGSYVSGVSVDRDGRVIAVIRDWESNTTELAVMTKVKADEVVVKENITIGLLYSNSYLSKQAVEFNKTNEKYHIKIKTYMDESSWSETSYSDALAKMTNDITSGNGPDILDVSNLDIKNFVSKGAIEDLTPYLEKSTVLSKEDFFENILKSSTYDGVLAYLPSGFTLQTLAAKTSEVGNKMGWTVSDIISYAKAHPGSELIEYSTRDSILTMMLMLNQEHFMDLEAGTCNFDSQDFKDLLMFAGSFPENMDNIDNRLTPHKLADGSLLLANAYISRFEDVQSTIAYFSGEEVTFIGYPSYDGGNGCLMTVMDGYAISSKSEHKDAAWAFLEGVLTREVVDDWSFYAFSSRKSVFEKQKEKATTIEYIYDENGEVLLDENGEPVIAGQGGGWSMIGEDGEEWSFENKPITPEETAMVEKLLDGAMSFSYHYDEELMKIITEEAAGYFGGDKSVDEVAGIIQNRVGLYVKENM